MLKFSAVTFLIGITTGYIYFNDLAAGLVIFLCLYGAYPAYKQNEERKMRQLMLIQFKDLLYSISASLSLGRNMRQALEEFSSQMSDPELKRMLMKALRQEKDYSRGLLTAREMDLYLLMAVYPMMHEEEAEAKELYQWILSFRPDYFTNMHLPELACWQAMAWKRLGHEAPAQELVAAHLRAQDAAEAAVDPGYYGTTPFFISYMEDPAVQRKAAADWQRAMAHFAAGDLGTAREYAQKALAGKPDLLYAGLLAR